MQNKDFFSGVPIEVREFLLRLLKTINDTASLNNSSVVSNVYTPTIPHLNTYAASRHSGIPIHHVPMISIIIMVFVLPPLLIMPPPRIIFSTLTGAYRANTMSSVFPSSFTLSSTRYNPVYAPAKRLGRKEYNEAYTESKKIMYAGLFGGVTVSALLILLTGAYRANTKSSVDRKSVV